MTSGRVLVTGASGFIGRHLVDRLLRDGADVIVLVRPGRGWVDGWDDRVDVAECADWTEAGLRQAVAERSFGEVFHLAAYGINPADRDIDQTLRINLILPAILVRLCGERGAVLTIAGTFSE